MTCGSPAYLAAQPPPAVPADLAGHACIAFEGLYSKVAWTFAVDGAPATSPIHPRFSSTPPTLRSMLRSPDRELRASCRIKSRGRSKPAPWASFCDFKPEPLPVHLVYPAQALLPLKLRAFLDSATPRLKATLAGASG